VIARSETLQARKQQLVKEAIWDAAIDLFVAKGFDEATVEEIARAAGVSRRSFFRYFASKKDLMAQGVLLYGATLRGAIEACARSYTLLETMERVTLEVAKHTASQPRTRQIYRIAESSMAANEALLSSLPAVEVDLSEAFEARLKKASKDLLKPRLLAALTLAILNTSLQHWCRNEPEDISIVIRQAFATISQVVCQ